MSPRPGRGEWELVGAGAVGLGRGGPGRAGERLEPRSGLQQDKAVRATRTRGRSSGARARRGPLLRVPGPTGFRAQGKRARDSGALLQRSSSVRAGKP